MSSSQKVTNTCQICCKTSNYGDDTLLYGQWMEKSNIIVHYYCLLLSTNLPQHGKDFSGMLGFLLKDIQREIKAAKLRTCRYCLEDQASISCFKCKRYYHLACGLQSHVRVEFINKFQTYCYGCDVRDEYKQKLLYNPPTDAYCCICYKVIKTFYIGSFVYPDCCKLGFAHHSCMQKYALAAGYYLRCLWCRKTEFRDKVRLQSIFVPDRDAEWERVKNAYGELLHNIRCDISECICQLGRNHSKGKWELIKCLNCGSFGAHPECLKQQYGDTQDLENFKCDICLSIEDKVLHNETILNMSQDAAAWENINPLCVTFTLKSGMAATDTEETPLPLTANTKEQNVVPTCSQKKALDRPLLPTPLRLRCAYDQGGYFFLEVYEFDKSNLNCIGTITLRFNMTDRRITDRRPISLLFLEVEESDIVSRRSDRGIYATLDKLIVENLTKNKTSLN